MLSDYVIDDSTLTSALMATRSGSMQRLQCFQTLVKFTRFLEWLDKAKLIFQLRHQRQGVNLSRVLKIIKCSEAVCEK